MSSSTVALVSDRGVQHTNLPQEVLELSSLLRCSGEDELLLGHGLGIMGGIELFVLDFNSQGELCSFGIELAETGDLPSQPPVVKVFNLALQVDKVTTGSEQEGPEPGGEWFDRDFLTMPNRVSLHVEVNDIRGLIQALAVMVSRPDSTCHLIRKLSLRFRGSGLVVGVPPTSII
jgi:hypothetical protein